MHYAVRIHILKNTTFIPSGHAFIDLKSPTGSKYYELNSNDNLPKAFSLWMLGRNPISHTVHEWADGIVRKTNLVDNFLTHLDGDKYVKSQYIPVSQQRYEMMEFYGSLRTSIKGGFVDYIADSNSCITYVQEMMSVGGITTPLASLFTTQDIVKTGQPLIWATAPLRDVPRPNGFLPQLEGPPDPVLRTSLWAAEMGLPPTDWVPTISIPKSEAEGLLGHAYDR